MRRRLILRQGDKPPESPGPLSLGIHVPDRERICQGFASRAKPRALDRFFPFRRATGMRERGPLGGVRRRPSLVASNATKRLLDLKAKNLLPRRPPARYNNLRSWPRPYGRF